MLLDKKLIKKIIGGTVASTKALAVHSNRNVMAVERDNSHNDHCPSRRVINININTLYVGQALVDHVLERTPYSFNYRNT